jgi:competence protein ComEA
VFTKKEKNLILVIVMVLLAGALWSLMRSALKKQVPVQVADVKNEAAFNREDEQRSEADRPPEPVNINTASQWELETLPNIGPEKARAIITYRTTEGPFKNVEDLTKIKGIGPATIEKLKPYIMIQQ